jgi:hypothetical protein
MLFFIQRSEFDVNAQYGLNVLRRKASILHSSEMACERTEKSIEYFGYELLPGVYRSPIQYYMALVNHSGNLISAGKPNAAYEFIQKSLSLETLYSELTFPRMEVAINNCVLSGYLSKNLKADECLGLYDMLFTKLEGVEDRILLRNNYNIFLALNNNLPKALANSNDLMNVLHSASRKDNYYSYFVGVNHACFNFLNGNRKEALAILEKLY